MDPEEFVKFGKAIVDYVKNYKENVRDRRVLPNVEPGYLSKLLPNEAPTKAETWQEIMKDMERVIMPGITHWCSPQFHAFYPSGSSYPSIVGELMSAGFGCIGLNWLCSPAYTELEVIMMNWLGKMLNLPEVYLNSSDGTTSGVIQGSASESTFVCLLAAKNRTIHRIKKLHPEWDEDYIKSKLVCYTSDQSNSSVEKAGIIASTEMRLLPVDETLRLRGDLLLATIEKDLKDGFIPCYAIATLGTTGICAFDDLTELGPICNKYDVWLHVDAAYAGTAFVCPEYRHLMAGIDLTDSFNINCHKWMLVNFDCSALWIKNSQELTNAMNIDRIYLQHNRQGLTPDFRHWQIPLGRRFRSLKLWFVLRLYGVEGIQRYIRNHIRLSHQFKMFVEADDRFEIVTAFMTVICFRMKGGNLLTQELLARLNARRLIYLMAVTLHEKFLIRFVTCSEKTEERDILFAWKEISEQADEVLKCKQPTLKEESVAKPLDDIVSRIEDLNLSKSKTMS